MSELVLTTSTLPEPLVRLIPTEKIRVNKANGVISLTPIEDSNSDCPLLGLAADSSLTVDSFRAMTHDEVEMGA
jgi:hypothetical protein